MLSRESRCYSESRDASDFLIQSCCSTNARRDRVVEEKKEGKICAEIASLFVPESPCWKLRKKGSKKRSRNEVFLSARIAKDGSIGSISNVALLARFLTSSSRLLPISTVFVANLAIRGDRNSDCSLSRVITIRRAYRREAEAWKLADAITRRVKVGFIDNLVIRKVIFLF